ncbi:MAG: NADH-quinone oxidoreductase subunit C [Dehalococcoidales bacterium]|nr:NADH-quinone oxidoreductase subunit C [Dehalococcoidales bacterium]
MNVQKEEKQVDATPSTPPAEPEIENLERLPVDQLVPRVARLAGESARLIGATCVDVEEGLEVIYHFDRNLEMTHLSVVVPKTGPLPSITGAYFCAFLAENEIEELFGLAFEGKAIDYKGRLLMPADAQPTPMLKNRKEG